MADSSDVDAAVIAILAADPALTALMPHGVYIDVARPGDTHFVLVSQFDHADDYVFDGPAWEVFVYRIKAVALGKSGSDAESDVKAAAARIHQLLQDAVFQPTGYAWMRCQRVGRAVRYQETDDFSGVRWQHRGGQYEVWMQPLEGG